MKIPCKTLVAICLIAGCLSAHAAVALFTLDELTSQSRFVFVGEVIAVLDPKWKDEQGNDVLLADVNVVHSLKGRTGERVVVAYKARVDDQEQLQARHRYVLFAFGPSPALLMGHQVRAFTVQGDEVLSSTIKGQPERQSLKALEQNIARAVKTP